METCKIVSYLGIEAERLGRPGCQGAKARRLISEEDGSKNFHARIIEILPSGMIPPHKHDHEHCAFILEGKCIIVCGGKEKTAETGSVVFIPSDVIHSWHNKTNKVTVFFLVDVFPSLS
ncbi:hypothetical protein DRO26_00590 [Candidatus Bathyarchaeota archaeon]|nr:MAG: hypothetical protein DRO26_00590 [Candidatus Bathyarchaeota archaeon]